ncbi:Glycoside hydrolase, family 37 [Cynara cardunculus var. scolymus]|uniref:Trehalase n=1 Tax=Cynara cardunculus var. scolymus TaxID=59895 RepID=A0A103XR14_CYNCS|nr:Glycoside hydrolase, family 37 [Cynara cardunculus var. scolymus]
MQTLPFFNLKMDSFHPIELINFTLFVSLSAAMVVNAESAQLCKPTDHGPVVPTTPLVVFLESIQETALNTFGPIKFDPKLYVDLSLKFDLPITKQAFNNLPRTENGSVLASDLNGFLKKFMNGAEEDLVYVEPIDYVAEPDGFLPKVVHQGVRDWALEVHSLWKTLSRKVSNQVLEHPELHTLLPLKHPVIIPGSRFEEVYYWDSYWVIRGLLASKMYETAKGIVINLIDLVDTYGYVLNGARAYYTNRSQPPLLSSMVIEVYKQTSDTELVKIALPALIKEHNFWNSGIHNVTIEDAHGTAHNLSRYYAMWNQPRPESCTIDKETADKLSTDCEKIQLYRELASTAETGWDFSTRWMKNTSDLTTLSTTTILPVDLNAYILKMELDIAFLANVIGESSHALHFTRASKARKKAMDAVFWNEEKGQWMFINGMCWTRIKIYLPLTSSQYGDFPNGWAPVQHMIVEGLVRSGSEEAGSLAKDIAIRWIRTNYATYKSSKAMHEKYDVSKCGEFGGGGEYVPQTGFGWSNGVVLAFLEEFGWAQDLNPHCQ